MIFYKVVYIVISDWRGGIYGHGLNVTIMEKVSLGRKHINYSFGECLVLIVTIFV